MPMTNQKMVTSWRIVKLLRSLKQGILNSQKVNQRGYGMNYTRYESYFISYILGKIEPDDEHSFMKLIDYSILTLIFSWWHSKLCLSDSCWVAIINRYYTFYLFRSLTHRMLSFKFLMPEIQMEQDLNTLKNSWKMRKSTNI